MSTKPPDPELRARIEECVKRMPRMQREIFLAIRIDKLSYDEIAERTGLTSEQVARQMARAMIRLTIEVDNPPPPPWWKRRWRHLTGRK